MSTVVHALRVGGSNLPGNLGWSCSGCGWKFSYEVNVKRALEVWDADSRHTESKPDLVNHPPHYTEHPSGVECITVVEHMGFNLGNAVKYVWRADLKDDALEDLRKAAWYIQREIERRLRGESS